MKNEVTIDWKKIKEMDKAIDEAMGLTADWLKSDVAMRQVVPKETGNLEGSLTGSTSGQVSKVDDFAYNLDYTTPYAQRLYFHPEYNFRKDKNPNAKGEWLKDYSRGKKAKELKEVFAKFLVERLDD